MLFVVNYLSLTIDPSHHISSIMSFLHVLGLFCLLVCTHCLQINAEAVLLENGRYYASAATVIMENYHIKSKGQTVKSIVMLIGQNGNLDLPMGKVDIRDRSTYDTAIRETYEETCSTVNLNGQSPENGISIPYSGSGSTYRGHQKHLKVYFFKKNGARHRDCAMNRNRIMASNGNPELRKGCSETKGLIHVPLSEIIRAADNVANFVAREYAKGRIVRLGDVKASVTDVYRKTYNIRPTVAYNLYHESMRKMLN